MRGGLRACASLAVAFALAAAPALPASAQTVSDDRVSARTVVFQPLDGTTLTVDGHVYDGPLTVSVGDSGLALVEETDVDSYLLGIREVPFSWEPETLAAQAVAARTYLAWTLHRGRSSNGRRFDYDICASTACQVYVGLDGLTGEGGAKWRTAVSRTSGEILTFRGAPIQAMYSSTTDGRTRNLEDVFTGASPLPYLVAVDSPGETSPFVSWHFTLSQDQAQQILEQAGLVDGTLTGISSDRPDDGEGPWTVTIESTGGSQTVDTWTLRSAINRAAAALFPDDLPARMPDSDRRYPQTIMSPAYTITTGTVFTPPIDRPPRVDRVYEVTGGGWGHLVGMSQFGAQAMATAGAGYSDILSHYYGGIRPTVDRQLPDTIRVGLETDAQQLEVTPDGPVRVVIDGQEASPGELGSWGIAWADGLALVDPPAGLGLAPEVSGGRAYFDSRGVVELVTFRSRTAAEVRIVVREAGVVVFDSGTHIREAGIIAVDLDPRLSRSVVTVQVIATSPLGGDVSTLKILGGAE